MMLAMPVAIATCTAALTLWSFIGLEPATVPADDVEDPRRIISSATRSSLPRRPSSSIKGAGLMPPAVLACSTRRSPTLPGTDPDGQRLGLLPGIAVGGDRLAGRAQWLSCCILVVRRAGRAVPGVAWTTASTRTAPGPAGLLALGPPGGRRRVMADGMATIDAVFNVIIPLGTMTGVVPYAFSTAGAVGNRWRGVRPDEFSPFTPANCR